MSLLDKDEVIRISGVSKKYSRGSINAKTLADSMKDWWFSKLTGKNVAQEKSEPVLTEREFWALKDIDLSIKRGDTVGIIGANGAGKSTLLKLLCRITAPTTGRIIIDGRVTSMLEVGTGFNSDMTGRENIFLNGAILGLTEKQVEERLESIIEFSEIGDFIDTPVKRYSSGMFVKLAFAVSSHLDSEIVIMDEVLAVGDIKYQKKCIDKMLSMAKDGKHTILFVSHNPTAVLQLCRRGILLENGRLVFDGTAGEALAHYGYRTGGAQTRMGDIVDKRAVHDDGFIPKGRLESFVCAEHPDGVFSRRDSFCFTLKWTSFEDFERAYLALTLYDGGGECLGRTTTRTLEGIKAGARYDWQVKPALGCLNKGTYYVTLDLRYPDKTTGSHSIDCDKTGYWFEITDSSTADFVESDPDKWGRIELPETEIEPV